MHDLHSRDGSDPSSRRLPVYLLIDTSCSMFGDPIAAIEQGFLNLMARLSGDPHILEIAWLSIITFDTAPRQIVPLSPLDEFGDLPLKLGGSSNLGRALSFLKSRISEEVNQQTQNRKGDWKPLVFLMTDGQATDDWQNVVPELKGHMKIVVCGVGHDVNSDNLKQVTDTVILLKDLGHDTFGQFIDFASTSITLSSQEIEEGIDKLVIDPRYDKIVFS